MIDSNNSFPNKNNLITFSIRFIMHDKADVIVDVLINLQTTLLSYVKYYISNLNLN